MILIKYLVMHFKANVQLTVDKKIVADFPQDSYWEITGRNLGNKTVTLKNTQWGQKITLTFECYAYLLSSFDNENILIIPKKNVPKVIHLKTS